MIESHSFPVKFLLEYQLDTFYTTSQILNIQVKLCIGAGQLIITDTKNGAILVSSDGETYSCTRGSQFRDLLDYLWCRKPGGLIIDITYHYLNTYNFKVFRGSYSHIHFDGALLTLLTERFPVNPIGCSYITIILLYTEESQVVLTPALSL